MVGGRPHAFRRYSYYGPTPLFLIDANVRGSGKGLLADCAITIATGREPARTTAPKSDEEAPSGSRQSHWLVSQWS